MLISQVSIYNNNSMFLLFLFENACCCSIALANY